MIRKPKKKTKYRGSKTHGCGSMKKRRGKGNKGGAGNAGTGKRADSKRPTVQKLDHYFGKDGFSKKNKRIMHSVNLNYIEEQFDTLLSQNIIIKNNNLFELDLKKMGFNKLLGAGKFTRKMIIKAEFTTNKAVEKVQGLGGKVELPVKVELPAEEQ